jgi:hypothetical protein
MLLIALICIACDSFMAFYIQNETDDLHYVRVTVQRTGGVYVHRVEPGASGYAAQGLTGAGDDDDHFTVELLDRECNPIDEWGMPFSGGLLRIDEEPHFVPGYYSEPVDSTGPSDGGSGAANTHVSVIECGATETIHGP